ncbi:unnamed protein product, partial [Aphanomyces euteiches]
GTQLQTPPTTQLTTTTTKATPSPTTAAPTTAAPTPAPTTASPVPPPSSPSTGALKFESKVDGIYLNGAPFYIKGAGYFGMETNSYAPHGLWGGPSSTSEQKVSTLLKTNNFNAVRLPLAVDSVLNNPPAVASQISSEVDLANAFSGKTLRFLDVLDHVIQIRCWLSSWSCRHLVVVGADIGVAVVGAVVAFVVVGEVGGLVVAIEDGMNWPYAPTGVPCALAS